MSKNQSETTLEIFNRKKFNDWFSKILLIEGESCLTRDVIRNKKEELWEEWKKVDPYGVKEYEQVQN